MHNPAPLPVRTDFPHLTQISTRWMDNDVYGHINNVVYYAFFDTAVNAYLIAAGALDPTTSPVIGLVVETGCRYFQPLSYPEPVTAGVRVTKLGNTSVRYEVGLFRPKSEEPAAFGHFVHVYVDRHTRRPTPLPLDLREALAPLMVG
jgi:acyl-CoA thioester hydrolase